MLAALLSHMAGSGTAPPPPTIQQSLIGGHFLAAFVTGLSNFW